LNLSKSGLSVSTGIKGLSISKGPQGTYLNTGKKGFYYRTKLNPKKSKAGFGSSLNWCRVLAEAIAKRLTHP
jgi:hypothetical protein